MLACGKIKHRVPFALHLSSFKIISTKYFLSYANTPRNLVIAVIQNIFRKIGNGEYPGIKMLCAQLSKENKPRHTANLKKSRQ